MLIKENTPRAIAAAAAALVCLACTARADANRTVTAMRDNVAHAANNANSFEGYQGDKVERKQAGFLFHRASSVPAAEQLAAAEALDAANRRGDACSAYNRLVRSFPFSHEAAIAQLKLGRLLEKRGNYQQAFEEYHYMLKYYPENAPADALLGQMFAIANHWRGKDKLSTALKDFQRIAEIAPNWTHTPEVLLNAGAIQMDSKDYYDAAETFDTIIANAPGTPSAATATDLYALALAAIARKYPEDASMQIRALGAVTTALRLGDAKSPNHAAISDAFAEINARRAAKEFAIAKFYDKPRFPVATRKAAYENFLRLFPAAPQADEAKARISQLNP